MHSEGKKVSFFVSIKNACARCGERHAKIQVRKFRNPIKVKGAAEEFTHWGICPVTEEPILIELAG